ncbi:sugar transferase [Maribacter aestuarii]|uniref:sugar transferase n=1 Tax=Maribacter aestuarii TaxID=1130723 RepID=UPI00248C55F1|nr:sugar transferase [Maribacter aestuarii]
MKDIAPIVLFTYNRIYETKQTILALQRNFLAPYSNLIIFSDGPKNDMEYQKVKMVREYLKTIDGFQSIEIHESEENNGLANSIVSGVKQVLKKYDSLIVLEDDLLTSPNFLNFMNQALEFYETHPKVMSISGYTMNLPSLKNYDKDFYVGLRASSWGWGTWSNKWEHIDWEVRDYSTFKKSPLKRYKFFSISSDLPYMLHNQMSGKIDSWAIRWCYHQFKEGLITVFPSNSKVNSIGLSESATHTSGAFKFISPLDQSLKTEFEFEKELHINKNIIKDFKRKFSITKRLCDKARRAFRILKNKFGLVIV